MKELERLDILIDLSLNGEASEQEIAELQELAASSDEMMEHYFNAIDHQLTFQQQFEDSTLDTSTIETKSKPFPLMWLIVSTLIIVLMIVAVSVSGTKIPQKVKLSVSSESHDISILRNSKDLNSPIGKVLENLDLVDVGPRGELWLTTENKGSIYLAGGSQIRMEKKSTEAFQLLKGSLSADLTKSKGVLAFISRDIEIVAEAALFSAQIKNNITKVCVMEGNVKLTRLKDGKTLILSKKQTAMSDNFSLSPSTPEDSNIFPKLEKGVNYYYFELKDGTYDENRLIDEGIVDGLFIKKGQHEGYVRNRPDSHSDVSKGPFHILLKSNFKVEKAKKFYFKLYGRKGSSLSISNKVIVLDKDFETKILEVDLNTGLNPLQVHSPGVLDKDKDEYELNVEVSSDNKTFQTVSEKKNTKQDCKSYSKEKTIWGY